MMTVIAFGASVWKRVFVTLLASTATLSSPAAVNEPELLEPEKAFRISTRALDPLPHYTPTAERFAKRISFIVFAVGAIMLVLAAGGRTLFAPVAGG